MATIVHHVRQELIAAGLVRDPGFTPAGARPWLPPAWRHPDDGGAIAPGDAADQGMAARSADDGLVVTVMHAPGIPSMPGAEERRILGVDVIYRSLAVPPVWTLDRAVYKRLLGDPPNPGGRMDFVLAGNLYVIQAREWAPLQPLGAPDGQFAFKASYTFETRI